MQPTGLPSEGIKEKSKPGPPRSLRGNAASQKGEGRGSRLRFSV